MFSNGTCIVSPSRSRYLISPFFQISGLCSNTNTGSFDFEFLDTICSNRFGINVITLKQKSWSHSCINLVASSIYFLLAEPVVGKRKRFLHQKSVLSYILFIINNEIEVYLNVTTGM